MKTFTILGTYTTDSVEKKILQFCIADDELYNKCSSKKDSFQAITVDIDNIIGIYEFIDSIFNNKTDLWNVCAFPSTESEDGLSILRKIFPGIFYDSKIFSYEADATRVYIDGTSCPGAMYWGGNVYTALSNYRNHQNIFFPSFGANNDSGPWIAILPDSAIQEDKINFDFGSDIGYIRLEVIPHYLNNNKIHCKVIYSFEPTPLSSIKFWSGKAIKEISNDPFDPGGDSGTGGGSGDFDNTSTPIEIPGLPTVSASSTGFISLFNPTLSQLNELASYMWSDIFDIDTLKKLFADPMDVILGLSILPVQIPSSGAREVKIGNIGTGISLNVASTQFVEVDCGAINVNEYWGAYLDYSPYTHAQIYLPYVGVRPISVDEIMGKSVNVKYHVDILTGACCCFVKCGESVLYTFNGQCSIPIPITATNYTNTINGIINVASSLGMMVATGGASAPLAAANLASTITNQMKPTVEKSGAISGPGGVMGIQTPYLILTRPRQALPFKQNTFTGYPSFITVTLGELSGYTEVHSIHLENIPATADELSEIETLLKGGVIF